MMGKGYIINFKRIPFGQQLLFSRSKIGLGLCCANAVPGKFRPIPFIETIVTIANERAITIQKVESGIEPILLHTDITCQYVV